MTKDPRMTNIFPKTPMVAFKQPSNLKKKLSHAKLKCDQFGKTPSTNY
jgi:hypothetical protein